ncbi:hypothetical protein BF49_6167 [Bradyrhizobium sp.]|nr:hypothetical protein BF49_6167 [Bradyrhizobium sp.]
MQWSNVNRVPPAIVGGDLAANLGMSLPAVFAGTWGLARK